MKKALFFLAVALMGLAANAQVAFEENFDNVSTPSGIGVIPDTWTLYGDNLSNANQSPVSYMNDSWCVINFQGSTPAAFSSTWTSPAAQVDRWMVTPEIVIPSTGYSLTFYAKIPNPNYPEAFKVMVSTTGVAKTDFTATLLNEPTAATEGMRIANLDAYAGQTIHLAFVNYGNDKVYIGIDDIKVSVLPQVGIAFYGAVAAPYAAIGGECTVQFAVENQGLAALTSYDYDVTVDGTALGETRHVTGVNVNTFDYDIQSFTIPVNAVGQHTISITVSNPNGQTDPDLTDNSGTTSTKGFDPSTFSHSVLIENFTTAQCQYCPAGHERLSEAVAPFSGNVVWVAHHTGYGSDNMTLHQSEEIAGYATGNSIQTWEWHPGLYAATAALDAQGRYTHGGTSAPAMAIDRNAAYAIEPESDGVVGSVGSVSQIEELLMQDLRTPGKLTLGLDNLSYNATTREVKVTVEGMFLENFSDELRLNVWVIEDGIIGSQYSATEGQLNNYVHNHVLRTLVTPTWGENAFNMGTNSGNTYKKSYTFTLANNINAQNARIVAFVGKAGSSDSVFTDRHVLNAIQSRNLTDEHLDIQSIDVEANMNVYPNPATDKAYISANGIIRSMTLTDISGRRIQEVSNMNVNEIELNVSRLEAGIYFISVTTDEGTTTQKLNVVK